MKCNDFSYRTGTADSPVYECNLDIESAEHYLLHRTRFQEARNKLQEVLDEISESASGRKRLQLSEALLLAPKSDVVTRKENLLIKDALFEFIADRKVKLYIYCGYTDDRRSTPSSIPLLTYQCFYLDVLCRVEATLKFSLSVFT